MAPSRSRSQSRPKVDPAQRCRMLRRFHQHLLEHTGPEKPKSLHRFTDEMLGMMDDLIGDNDWETVPEGEATFDDKWWNPQSLIAQMSHVKRWHAEMALPAATPVTQPPAVKQCTTDSGSTEEAKEAEDRELSEIEKELARVSEEYSKIPKDYLDWLMSRRAVMLAGIALRETEKRCKEAEQAVQDTERKLAEVDRRLRGATKSVFTELGMDGDRLPLTMQALNAAQRKMLNDANEWARSVASDGVTCVVSGLASLNLQRRNIKEERNGLYKTWKETIKVHQCLHNDIVAKQHGLEAAEDGREKAYKRWENCRQGLLWHKPSAGEGGQ